LLNKGDEASRGEGRQSRLTSRPWPV